MEWIYTFGGSDSDWSREISYLSDDLIAIAGWSNSEDGHVSSGGGMYDMWLLVTDTNGVVVNSFIYGGQNSEQAKTVCQGTNNMIVLGGEIINSSPIVPDYYGGIDLVVLALHEDGQINWAKAYGGSANDYIHKIFATNDGYIIGGSTWSDDGHISQNFGESDYWIVKVDFDGNILWETNLGGTGRDDLKDIRLAGDGDILVVGTTNSTDGQVGQNNGSFDTWAVRLSSDGQVKWATVMGGPGADQGKAIVEFSNGNILVASTSYAGSIDYQNNRYGQDIHLYILSDEGFLLSEKTIDYSTGDEIRDISIDQADNILMVGSIDKSPGPLPTDGDADQLYVMMDQSLEVLCDTTFGGKDFEFSFASCVSPGGSFYVAGISESPILNFAGQSDFLISKISGCKVEEPSLHHQFVVPNAFTPDGNETNDLFEILWENEIPDDFDLKIYNRWGELQFHTNDPLHFWDGTSHGRASPADVYLFVLRIHIPGHDFIQSGEVLLIR